MTVRLRRPCILAAALLMFAAVPLPDARAYIEAPMTLADVVNQSNMITLMRISKVDKSKNLIVFEKVEDIKGKFPTQTARHLITGQLKEGEIRTVMELAEPGRTAVFFAKDGACEMALDMYWYQIYKNGEDLYGMSHGEPFLLRSYAGKADRLPAIARAIMEGREVIVPAMEDNKELLHKRAGKIMRLKTSLKAPNYDPKRDFVGWGGEDIRRIPGGTGFSHLGPLARVDSEARGVSAIDIDGDGKIDLCFYSGGSVRLFMNQGDAYSETSLPGLRSGARSASWGDFNGDGKPDLLLACLDGPRLFTNLGGGAFRDDSGALPRTASGATSAAFLDADGDGKPDVVVATAFGGLKLFRNNRPADAAQKSAPPKMGDWMLIGPFDNTGGAGFEKAYPPEQEIDYAKQYPGKNQVPAAWKKMPFADAAQNNLAVFQKPELNSDVTVYIAREIESSGVTEIPLSLGSDDGLAVFVNGERVLAENTARAWAPDQNRCTIRLKPGKNTLLLKITQGGGEFAFSCAFGPPVISIGGWFDDVSEAWGTATAATAAPVGTAAVHETMTVTDLNGDGKPDILFSDGRLLRNTGSRFESAGAVLPGLTNPRAKLTLGDIDGDGVSDVVAVDGDRIRIFRRQGAGVFSESSATGELAKPIPGLTSATIGDIDNDGKADIAVGTLRGLNRIYVGDGTGKFADRTLAMGLDLKIFNTRAIATADLNGDGRLDLIMANEGQDSAILFGNKELPTTGGVPVTIHPPGESFGLSTKVTVQGKAGSIVVPLPGTQTGGQGNLYPRLLLAPGDYAVTMTDGNGRNDTKKFAVTDQSLKVRFDERHPPKTETPTKKP